MKNIYFKSWFLLGNILRPLFVGLFLLNIIVSNGQVLKPFTQRASTYTPSKKIYNIKGDFTMIGNTNLTLQNYTDNGSNSSAMQYVDVDNDVNTLNSSSAELTFSTENGAVPGCSNIVYAGLYWTGRAHDGDSPISWTLGGEAVNRNNGAAFNGYSLAISQTPNNKVTTYTFTPINSGDAIVFTFTSNPSNSVTVKVGSGNATTCPASYQTGGGGFLWSDYYLTATFTTPYTIPGTSIIVNSLRKRTDTNALDSYFWANVSTPSITLDKRVVKLRYGNESYQTVTANSNDIYYPTTSDGYMYSAYAEVTDYVKSHGIGEYTVADIALQEGDGGSTGYYGGWGLIVVYENSKMNWRDVTIFDGHAYVQGSTTISYNLPVSGFHTAQDGH